uniref:Uncharacterized protein n=1 Tax=Engystomops pustulosus TaxID=76066 RepID=A0AAV6YU74_ENGPU|nr:hypothetical protein GDO81_030052 [Engystomops pustulosus]
MLLEYSWHMLSFSEKLCCSSDTLFWSCTRCCSFSVRALQRSLIFASFSSKSFFATCTEDCNSSFSILKDSNLAFKSSTVLPSSEVFSCSSLNSSCLFCSSFSIFFIKSLRITKAA